MAVPSDLSLSKTFRNNADKNFELIEKIKDKVDSVKKHHLAATIDRILSSMQKSGLLLGNLLCFCLLGVMISLNGDLNVAVFMQNSKSINLFPKPKYREPVPKALFTQNASFEATARSEPRRYVCTQRIGRLGNNIFQFATSFAVAYAKDMTAVTPLKGPVNNLFDLKRSRWLEITLDNSLCRGAKSRKESLASGYDLNLINFKPDASYILTKYLQSYMYFKECIPELKKQLVFRKSIQQKVNAILANIIQGYGKKTRADVVLIAVHIRRGDLFNNPFGYKVANSEYIQKAVKHFADVKNRIFVVCSNDMTWSKANMPKNEKVEYVIGNPREVDFAVLASCDHIITTVGSFGWWAGFLNKGTVLYYKWPAKEGSNLRREYSKDYSDYFMPNWIGL